MQIHVARPPTQLGVFSPEEIAEGLRTGRFLANDQGWREGMAAWMPLGQWAEFAAVAAGAGVPDSPVANGASSENAPSQVPWERGKSVGSFFATVKGAIVNPVDTFANARFGFGEWVLFSYITHFLMLPVRIIQEFAYENMNAQMIRFFEGSDGSFMRSFVEGLRNQQAAQTGQLATFTKVGAIVGQILFGPLMIALIACFTWLALWALRQNVAIGRHVGASLMASSVASLVLIPFGLSAFSFVLFLVLGFFFTILYLIVFSRAHGAGIQRSPWLSFGAHFLAYLVMACCVGCAIGSMVMLAMKAR